MINRQDNPTPQRAKKKCTLIFFFASDNALSPSTLPQLKAIKSAGWQDDTNVLVYFDPNEKGAPTRVFEINRNKGATTGGADPSEPVVSVLSSDSLSQEEIESLPGPEAESFAKSLSNSDELRADKALDDFLGFCRANYPADHYMLFLLGHGLVVGRDAFLPDDNPDSAIGLKTLGDIVRRFSDKVRAQNQKFDLIGMHSCSMSAVEVAYELKDTAKYMMGSQGLSFVGSWPYRQLLQKIFKEVAKQGDIDVDQLVRRLHTLCIQYSIDYMHAGFSSDMCLCSLDQERIKALTGPISELSKALHLGAEDARCRDLIVLAHWKSQSYWQETYTDLYDFCLCLDRLCREPKNEQSEEKPPQFRRQYDELRRNIIDACAKVMNSLKPENGRASIGPVVRVDYVGPDVQYSHGLSIYFPWSHAVQDDNDHVITNYGGYAFTADLTGLDNWLQFLKKYFEKTQRSDRLIEEERWSDPTSDYRDQEYIQLVKDARTIFPGGVSIGSRDFYPTSALEGKVTPPDATGGGCGCASVKNYSKEFSLSPGAAAIFKGPRRQQSASAGSGSSSTGSSSTGSSSAGGSSTKGSSTKSASTKGASTKGASTKGASAKGASKGGG